MARFFVDEDLPRTVARALSAAGHGALHVIDAGLRGASDDDVMAYARQERRVLVSADVGFGNILRFPVGSHPGVIVSRLGNEVPSDAIAERLVGAVAFLGADIAGALVMVGPLGVRVRRPPNVEDPA